MNKILTPRFFFLSILIILAGLTRLIPAMYGSQDAVFIYNITAIGAMALFGGSMMQNKGLGILMPIIAMWLSDLILCNTVYSQYYDGFVWISSSALWVWPSIALMAVVGMVVIKKMKVQNIVLASFIAPAVFFLITNFGAWIGNPLYTQDFAGLMTSYAAGLPFFKNDIVGTLVYSGVIFGAYYSAQLRFPVLAKA